VDVAVKALVFFAQQILQVNEPDQSERQQTIFHLDNPDSIAISQFFEVYNGLYPDEKPLQGLPIQQWLEVVKQIAENNNDISIYPLMMEAANVNEEDHHTHLDKTTEVHSEKTRHLLQQGSLSFPEVDQSLMSIYLRFVVQSLIALPSQSSQKVTEDAGI